MTVDRIITLVSKRLSIPVGDIRSKQRTANVVNARHVSIYMIRQLTDVTFNTIGEIFGRDHSTIMAAFRRVESMMTTDPEFAALVNGMMEEIRN